MAQSNISLNIYEHFSSVEQRRTVMAPLIHLGELMGNGINYALKYFTHGFHNNPSSQNHIIKEVKKAFKTKSKGEDRYLFNPRF